MLKHLERKHGINIEKIKKENNSSSINSESNTPSTGVTGQLRLQEAFTMKRKLTRTSTRHTSITRAIDVFIAKDMRPFSVLEYPGFVKLVHELEPRYNIPCRTHFSEKVIPKLYEDTKSTVSECLKQANFLALTTDSLTSRATQSYNTVTTHFIHGWKLIKFICASNNSYGWITYCRTLVRIPYSGCSTMELVTKWRVACTGYR